MNAAACVGRGEPLPNVWLGVSVEDQKTADERIPLLLQTPAAVRFVSYEPALGLVNFRQISVPEAMERHDGQWTLLWDALTGFRPTSPFSGTNDNKLDWVIVGGESGPGARPFNIQWARDVIAQCKAAGVACFVKQLGSKPVWDFPNVANHEVAPLKDRKGGNMSEWPEDLRVREFPTKG